MLLLENSKKSKGKWIGLVFCSLKNFFKKLKMKNSIKTKIELDVKIELGLNYRKPWLGISKFKFEKSNWICKMLKIRYIHKLEGSGNTRGKSPLTQKIVYPFAIKVSRKADK